MQACNLKFSIFIILLQLILIKQAQGNTGTITVSFISSNPNTVNSSSSLNFGLFVSKALSANDYIAVTFPSSITITLSSCKELIFFKTDITGCTFNSQVLKLVIPSSASKSSLLVFQVGGFTNPGSAKPIAFSFKIYDSSDVLHSEALSDYLLSATSQQLSVFSLISVSNTVGQQSATNLQFTTRNPIPSGGMIKLTFPRKWNPNAPIDSQKSYYSKMVTCTNLHANLKNDCALNGDTLTINVDSQINSGQVVSLTINSILIPRSVTSQKNINLSTRDGSDYLIDETSTLSLDSASTYSGRQFDSTSLSIVTTTQVQKDTEISFSIQLNLPVDSGSYFTIQAPSSVGVNGSLNSVKGSQSFFTTPTSVQSSNIITIKNVIKEYKQILKGAINLVNIKNPTSTQTTASFKIKLYTSDDNLIAEKLTGLTYTPTAGKLYDIAITPDSSEVSQSTTWKFSFKLASSLPTDSQIKITLPSQVKTSSSSNCGTLTDTTNISNVANCQISGQVITIKNTNSSSVLNKDANIIFKLAAASITNPLTTVSITSILIQTRVDAATGTHLVNSGTIVNPFNLTTGAMAAATVSASPSIVYNLASTYTIRMTSAHPYPKSIKIKITLPNQITFNSLDGITCSNVSNLDSLTCNATSLQVLEVSKTFSSQSPASTVMEFTVNNIRNQRTLKPTSSFKFLVQGTNVYGTGLIQQLNTGIVSTITLINSLNSDNNSFKITSNSNVNSAIATYTFTGIVTSVVLKTGDFLYVTKQTQVTNPSTNPVCQGQGALQASLTCSISDSNTVKVTLNFTNGQLSIGNELKFSISGYKNPSSSDTPSSHFSFLIKQSTDTYNIANLSPSNFYVRSTIGAQMTADPSTPISISSKIASFTKTTYTIMASTATATPLNSYIRIYLPPQVIGSQSPSTTCTATGIFSAISFCVFNPVNKYFETNQLGFTTTPGAFTISLTNLQNPQKASSTSSFIIQTLTSSKNVIDTLNSGLTVSVNCNAPCETCNSSNKSHCITCISNKSPNNLPYIFQTDNTCVDSCSTSFLYNQSRNICQACTTNCHTCSGSVSNCISCSGELNLLNNTCVSDCGEGLYPNGQNVCSTCDVLNHFCKTCAGSGTQCTTCTSSRYLQGTECKEQCDTGFIIVTDDNGNLTCRGQCQEGTVQVNGSCLKCEQKCKSCSGSIDNCTECADGYFQVNDFLNNKKSCQLTCDQSDGYVQTGKFCTKCGDEGGYELNQSGNDCQVTLSIFLLFIFTQCIMIAILFTQITLVAVLKSVKSKDT